MTPRIAGTGASGPKRHPSRTATRCATRWLSARTERGSRMASFRKAAAKGPPVRAIAVIPSSTAEGRPGGVPDVAEGPDRGPPDEGIGILGRADEQRFVVIPRVLGGEDRSEAIDGGFRLGAQARGRLAEKRHDGECCGPRHTTHDILHQSTRTGSGRTGSIWITSAGSRVGVNSRERDISSTTAVAR